MVFVDNNPSRGRRAVIPEILYEAGDRFLVTPKSVSLVVKVIVAVPGIILSYIGGSKGGTDA